MHFPAPITTLESSSAHLCSGSSINMQHQRRSPLMGQGLMPSFVQPDYVSSRAEFTGQQQQQYPALPCNRRYEHFRYHGAHLYPQTQEPYGSQQYPVQSGRHPPVTLYTNNAATKLTDGIRRRCFNCCTTDTNTWRRSKLSPGKIVSLST